MNKNIMKGCTGILLGLCLFCYFFCDISVKAATSGDWVYTVLSDGTVKIADYTGSATNVTIPSTIDGKKVTSIGEGAFERCGSLTSIMIPNSVTSIGYDAFFGCYSLTSITIPNSVTSIGEYAFSGCHSLTSITIPNSVTSIGEEAFRWCDSLTSITIPNSVTSIGECAFLGCDSLTSITIPNSVTSIGTEAFVGCKSLTNINVASSSTVYASQDGILYNKALTKLLCYPAGKIGTVTIPHSVTSIGEYAFEHCDSLTSITIPNSVMSIGECAFFDCDSLTSITIPNSVTSIENFTFFDCRSLTSITIPSSVTSIESGAFFCSSFDDEVFPIPQLVIHGDPNSVAQQYAEENGITFTTHNPVTDPAITPTCTTARKTEGSHCSICGEVMKAQQDIPATGHTYVVTAIPATPEQNGSITEQCSVCGEVKINTIIYAPSDIRLVKNSYTYNGKNKRPVVAVRDSNGNIVAASNYTVAYPKTCKAVGMYTVTVAFQGNYSGTAELTYTIKPKGTTISKLTAKKRGFTIKWKQQNTQTTGYQIQYSTSRSFKSAKTVTAGKSKKLSATVSKLKAGKKYYVRIRTYKTVKVNGKNKKIYSAWSKVKTVKTKR